MENTDRPTISCSTAPLLVGASDVDVVVLGSFCCCCNAAKRRSASVSLDTVCVSLEPEGHSEAATPPPLFAAASFRPDPGN